MHISFYVGPQWLTFAAGLLLGTAAAAGIVYVFLREQLIAPDTPRSKVKASRCAERACRRLAEPLTLTARRVAPDTECNFSLKQLSFAYSRNCSAFFHKATCDTQIV